MSKIYHVECIEKNETNVNLRLYIAHEDESEFYDSPTFALQLIWQPENTSTKLSSLGKTISIDNLLDEDWMRANSKCYINSAVITQLKNVGVDLSTIPKPWIAENKEKLTSCVLKINTTDKKWIEHLYVGQNWGSAAYNME